jgi:TP901 family phage tail tape measure protein
MATVAELKYLLTLDPKNFMGTLRKAKGEFEQTRRQTEKPLRLSQRGGAAILSTIAKISAAMYALNSVMNTFREFQTDIANVATLGVNNIQELEQSVLQLGSTAPLALSDLTAGLYQVVSAGVDAGNQMQVLENTAKAAKAGLAETTDALGLAASVVKSYGLEWSETEAVLDKAFQTVKLGQTTFAELSASIGKVTPLAATLKVSTEELFGAFATLTGVTGDTAIVSTQLRSILAAMAKPTQEMTAAIEKAGFASAELLIQQEGLVGALKFMQEHTGGSASEMAKLFGRIEAVNAALSLSGTQFETFVEKTDAMKDSTGELNRAFDIQSETLDSSIQLLKNNFDILIITVLKGLVPSLNIILGTFAGLIKAFNELSPAAKNLAVGIGILTIAVLKGRQAVLAMQAAFRLLYSSMGPVGWLILGAGVLAEALVFMAGSTDDAAESMRDLNEEFSSGDITGFKEEVSDTARVLNGLTDELEKWRYEKIIRDQFIVQGQLKTLARDSNEYADALAKFNRLEKERLALREKAGVTDQPIAEVPDLEPLTKKQIDELDKLRDYQFKSNRITLTEYIEYLKGRQDAVKVNLGAETAEYLKFVDRLNELQQKLVEQQQAEAIERTVSIVPKQLEVREDFTQPYQEFFQQLFDLQTEFVDLTFEQLENEFLTRKGYADLNVEIARAAFGEETKEFERAILQRLALERNYQQQKERLALAGAAAAAEAASAFLGVFQGQNKTLFEIGKAASIANATITQYEAAARAFKDYPFPFNIAIAATQLALVAGYIGRISAVQFNPAGFKEGTRQSLTAADLMQDVFLKRRYSEGGTARPLNQADVISSVFTPSGESGLVAVQTGEFIMNRRATRDFSDILRAMNEGQFQRPVIRRFQAGGPVGSPSPIVAAPDAIKVEDLQEIVDAIANIKIEIRAELDAMRFYKTTFSKFEKNRNERRIL